MSEQKKPNPRLDAAKLGLKFSPEADNDAAVKAAQAAAAKATPKVVVRAAKPETKTEKAKAAKSMREGSENEANAMKNFKSGGSVKKNWIEDAIKKPGALRASLGVKSGEKIPAKKLDKAAQAPGKMGQRARLAKTLKGFCGGGGIESKGKTRGRFI
jgi:hypothetical protein